MVKPAPSAALKVRSVVCLSVCPSVRLSVCSEPIRTGGGTMGPLPFKKQAADEKGFDANVLMHPSFDLLPFE